MKLPNLTTRIKVGLIILLIIVFILMAMSPWITKNYARDFVQMEIGDGHIIHIEKNIVTTYEGMIYIGGYNVYFYQVDVMFYPSFTVSKYNVDNMGRINLVKNPIDYTDSLTVCHYIGDNYIAKMQSNDTFICVEGT